MTRKEKLLKDVNLTGEGLELGPLCWPLLSKTEAHIAYVDHVSRDELLKIYKEDAGVVADLIPEIDYPLNGKSLAQAIPQKKFDYIIASHVIEHVPDMVRWFQDLAAVLKVGGVVSLAVPDKSYTFDIDRRTSEISDVMGAYIDSFTRASSTMIFDYASHFRSQLDASEAWTGELYLGSKAPHRYSLQQALQLSLDSKREYVDAHCYVFTPASFFEILRGLIELDLFDFKVRSFFETDHGQYEFLVSLEKVASGTSKRLRSVPAIAKDPYPREMQATIHALTQENERLRASLNVAQRHTDALLNSRSWRITKPLRHSANLAKKITGK